MTSVVAAAGVFVLATLAPFEATAPLVRLPGQAVSNLEAIVIVSLAAWGAAVVWTHEWPPRATPLVPAWLAFVAAMAVAAFAAPTRTNAWHMTGRLAACAAVYLLTVEGIATRARLRIALALSVASGVVVALLAILEYLQVGVVLHALQLFRPSMTAVGAQVRAAGSLQYPTIASMYLEIVFAFGLGLILTAIDERRPKIAAVWFAALVLIGEAIALTFTRAGLVTMALSLALAGALRVRRDGVERGVAIVGALAVVIGALTASSRSAAALWLRMTSETQGAWYAARVEAPAQLAMTTDRDQYVTVRVTNTGRVTWDSAAESPILFSYHWLQDEADRVVAYEGTRTPFAAPVPPGGAATVYALVRAPRQPGRYRLEWDLAEEQRLWFSTEPDAPPSTISRAIVTGEAVGGPIATSARPARAVRPGRLVLWRAAVRMIAAHPWLGVGPDNFRLLYGQYAGLAHADPRTHSNNMYLEILVGGGIVAAAVFAWLCRDALSLFATIALGGRGGRTAVRPRPDPGPAPVRPRSDPGPTPARPRSDPGPTPIGVAVAAAGVAIAVHALVDSFLSFAPTYVLFALTLGFAAAVARGAETPADAHRL